MTSISTPQPPSQFGVPDSWTILIQTNVHVELLDSSPAGGNEIWVPNARVILASGAPSGRTQLILRQFGSSIIPLAYVGAAGVRLTCRDIDFLVARETLAGPEDAVSAPPYVLGFGLRDECRLTLERCTATIGPSIPGDLLPSPLVSDKCFIATVGTGAGARLTLENSALSDFDFALKVENLERLRVLTSAFSDCGAGIQERSTGDLLIDDSAFHDCDLGLEQIRHEYPSSSAGDARSMVQDSLFDDCGLGVQLDLELRDANSDDRSAGYLYTRCEFRSPGRMYSEADLPLTIGAPALPNWIVTGAAGIFMAAYCGGDADSGEPRAYVVCNSNVFHFLNTGVEVFPWSLTGPAQSADPDTLVQHTQFSQLGASAVLKRGGRLHIDRNTFTNINLRAVRISGTLGDWAPSEGALGPATPAAPRLLITNNVFLGNDSVRGVDTQAPLPPGAPLDPALLWGGIEFVREWPNLYFPPCVFGNPSANSSVVVARNLFRDFVYVQQSGAGILVSAGAVGGTWNLSPGVAESPNNEALFSLNRVFRRTPTAFGGLFGFPASMFDQGSHWHGRNGNTAQVINVACVVSNTNPQRFWQNPVATRGATLYGVNSPDGAPRLEIGNDPALVSVPTTAAAIGSFDYRPAPAGGNAASNAFPKGFYSGVLEVWRYVEAAQYFMPSASSPEFDLYLRRDFYRRFRPPSDGAPPLLPLGAIGAAEPLVSLQTADLGPIGPLPP